MRQILAAVSGYSGCMNRISFTALVLSGLLSVGVAVAQKETPVEALLVLSKQEHTLAIVDPATLKVVAKVPVGDDPHEVIASADGRTAYVSNYGFGSLHTLAVVDLVGQKAMPAIDLGPLNGPHGLCFVGGKTWFTAEGAKAFGRYDPATGKVDLVLGTGQNRTHMIWVSADEQHIVTTNVSSGTVSLIAKQEVRMPPPPPGGPGGPAGPGGKPGGPGGPPPGPPPGPRTDWNETVVKVGNGSEGFDVSPDGREVWVANAGDGTISVIDLASQRVVATLRAEVPGANRLKFTLDGRHVLVSARGIVVLDAATRQVVTRIQTGEGEGGIVMSPDGKRAYASVSRDGDVAVIDLQTLTVVGRVDAGGEPDGLAWAVRR